MKAISAELGTSICTARHWLKQDHYEEWLTYWPGAEALVAESMKEWEGRPKPEPDRAFLDSLLDPDALEAEFDPLEDELMNAQRYASYRHHRQGRK